MGSTLQLVWRYRLSVWDFNLGRLAAKICWLESSTGPISQKLPLLIPPNTLKSSRSNFFFQKQYPVLREWKLPRLRCALEIVRVQTISSAHLTFVRSKLQGLEGGMSLLESDDIQLLAHYIQPIRFD